MIANSCFGAVKRTLDTREGIAATRHVSGAASSARNASSGPRRRRRPRGWPLREIINAIFCVLRSGCPWRLNPSTCQRQVTNVMPVWRCDECLDLIHRTMSGLCIHPTADIIRGDYHLTPHAPPRDGWQAKISLDGVHQIESKNRTLHLGAFPNEFYFHRFVSQTVRPIGGIFRPARRFSGTA